MSNIITGGFAVLLAVVFFLFYAIRLHSVVLWLIIGVNLAALLYDFYTSVFVGEDHI